jgi:hypothetical protein
MAFHARKVTLRGPSSVAVHDDRHMDWQAVELDLRASVWSG